jgi:hypothetical protein
MPSIQRMLSRMSVIDRRYIFLVMGLAVMLPFLVPISFSATPSEQTIQFSKALDEAIAREPPIFMELAFGNQTMSEMEPIALAVMQRLFAARKPVIFFTLYETAVAFTRRYLAEMAPRYKLKYGEDYVFLGFASAYTSAMYNLGNSVKDVYHEDDQGTPIDQLPIMRHVKSLKDSSALIDIAANSNPRFWVNFAVEPHGVTFLMACTAVDGPNYFPFLQTGQVKGLLAGGRAGAEFEGMLKRRGILSGVGDATRALGSQSLSLLVILAFIVIGNVGFFAGRRGRR